MPRLFHQARVPLLLRLRYAVIIFVLRILTRCKIWSNKLFDLRVGLVPKSQSISPTRKIWVRSSRDPQRSIEVHVFEPPRSGIRMEKPMPVHINFHGSGFVFPNMGEDSEQSAYWASTLGCVVLDADYVKSPENQHPAAIYDALDVVSYVISHSELYDSAKLTIGGVSAGATVAILTALYAPADTFRSVVAWYPITDFTHGEKEREVPPMPAGAPGFPLPWFMIKMFIDSLCPPDMDLADPRLSPSYAPSAVFPPIAFIVGENDPLSRDSIELATRLKADGVDCELLTVPEAGHAFDRQVTEGTPQWHARESANAMLQRRLRAAQAGL